MNDPRRPERMMVRRALAAASVAAPGALMVGWLAAGRGVGLSAFIAVVVVAANFAAHGWSLAWAAGVSVPVVHAVALGGFAVRMGVIVGLLFALDQTSFFSPVAFGVTAVAGTMALLVYEARLLTQGLGGELQIPPDPAAAAAAEALRLREESA
ncbi:MAG: hypothetical protein ACRDH8_14285 [Actinomycetota bacterium]